MFCPLCQRFIIGDYHPTTTRSDGFVAVKAQNPDFPETARMFATVITSKRFGAIFDEGDLPFFAECFQFGDFAWMSKCMHRHARFDSFAAFSMDTACRFKHTRRF